MKKNVVILHGWGLDEYRYAELVKKFPSKEFRVFCPDLPGFGREPLNNTKNLSDYVLFVKEYMKKHKIPSAIFIGHSFGGRIVVKLQYLYPELVQKMILTGVPIVRHFSIKKSIVSFVVFLGKLPSKALPITTQNIFRKIIYKILGEYDYYKAGKLKLVFTRIVNEDLFAYISHVSCPVLLVWGQYDTLTPKEDMVTIKESIPQARSIVVSNTTHSLPYKNPDTFFQGIRSFI